VKVPFGASLPRWPNDGDGMHFDVNFYWTTADTVSALVAAGGAMIGLTFDRIFRRLLRRSS